LILDLRDNPGGLLSEGAEVCDLFVASGKIVTVRGKGDQEHVIEAKEEGTIKDLPVAVLVNRLTGSSAEIFASCLQDHKRAAVIGEKTFGRGIVQSIVPLKATGGALKITTGVYLRPNGTMIYRPKDAQERGGVSPDEGMEVVWSDEQLQQYHEYRQQRDIQPADAAPGAFDDTQLAKALAHLREQIAP
jgi:carboxyl-terminal processing protease